MANKLLLSLIALSSVAQAQDVQRATVSTLVYEIQTVNGVRGLGRLVGSVEYGTPCGKVLLAEGYGKFCAIDRAYIEFGIELKPWVRVVAKCAAL